MVKKRKFKIEIVDDHVQTAVSISQLLEYDGFKTFQAYNVIDSIKICKKERPDLLILDIKLENESGYDVAKALPGQKILFMTSSNIDDSKASGFKNYVGIIKKPFDANELLEKVRKIFKISGQKKSLEKDLKNMQIKNKLNFTKISIITILGGFIFLALSNIKYTGNLIQETVGHNTFNVLNSLILFLIILLFIFLFFRKIKAR